MPKDFGTKKLTWTLVTNGQTETVTLWGSPAYAITPLLAADTDNTPPILKFDPAWHEVAGAQRHQCCFTNALVKVTVKAAGR